MVTGERRRRAAAMMIGEVDRRKTAEAVKCFCLKLRGCCGEPIFDRERAYAALK